MNKKINKSKQLLEQALKEMPHDYELSEIRGSITRAIKKLEHIESKSEKKQTQKTSASQWVNDLEFGLVNPFTGKGTVNAIDKMIEQERVKLKGNNDNDSGEGTNPIRD